MGLGRLGNFIDGQIVGGVTDVWWAVKFPDAEGFRHPVVLYDGAKNLLLMLFLMRVRKTNPTPGATAARFVFWYAFPRIFIDLFRDYPTHRLALGTGQTLNIVMAAVGLALLYRSRLRRLGRLRGAAADAGAAVRRSRACAAARAASRARVPADVLPDDSEQLDPGHPGPLRQAPPRASTFVALPADRYGSAIPASRPGRAAASARAVGQKTGARRRYLAGLRYLFHHRSSLSIRWTLFQCPPMPCGWPAYWIIFAGTPRRFSAKYICSPSSYGTR